MTTNSARTPSALATARRRRGAVIALIALATLTSFGCGSDDSSSARPDQADNKVKNTSARICQTVEQAKQEIRASSGDEGSATDKLGGIMKTSHEMMVSIAKDAPDEIRSSVVTLRDYYQEEIESGLAAEAPSAVDRAEGEFDAWIDQNC